MKHTSKGLPLAAWDHAYLWHPFTQMQEWEQETPLIIEKAHIDQLFERIGEAIRETA